MDTPLTSVLARLRDEFPDSSGRRLRAWLVAGRVRVSGEIVRDPRTPVAAADRVTLGPAPPPALAAPLRLVHEDESLLVIEKPPGLLTIGTEHERERTAYRMVWAYLKGARPSRRPFIVHRLDRETSGLLVVAKTPESKQYLQAQFFSGTAERHYVAIVEGVVTANEGTLRDVLVEERSLRVRPADPGRPPPKGRRARIAITRYRVIERRADVTRVALRLGTGRRHQIRVQLAKLGHPVVGDGRHGARRDPLRRLCLHATRLGFRHPDTGAPVEFDSAPPAAFGALGRPAERTSPPPAPRPERDARDVMRRPAPPGRRPLRAGPGPRPSSAEHRLSPPAPRPEHDPRATMRRPAQPWQRPPRAGPAPRSWPAEHRSPPSMPGSERDSRDSIRRPPQPGWRPPRAGPGPRPSAAERRSPSPARGPERDARDTIRRLAQPGRDAIRGPAQPGRQPPRAGPAPKRWPRERPPRRPPR
jgi:23S rRNA pseudouridine1911/1915/1917 synthase